VRDKGGGGDREVVCVRARAYVYFLQACM
jgi:hypothetical protein